MAWHACQQRTPKWKNKKKTKSVVREDNNKQTNTQKRGGKAKAKTRTVNQKKILILIIMTTTMDETTLSRNLKYGIHNKDWDMTLILLTLEEDRPSRRIINTRTSTSTSASASTRTEQLLSLLQNSLTEHEYYIFGGVKTKGYSDLWKYNVKTKSYTL